MTSREGRDWMLGVTPDDPESEEQAEGAVAELANVLVGTLVNRFCPGLTCEIGLPESYRGEPKDRPTPNADTALLRSDSGELIRVTWATRTQVPS